MNKKNTKAKSTKKRTKAKANPIIDEIIGISIIGIALLVIVSLFSDNVGILGELIKLGFVGFLGVAGYIVPPFALVLGGIYIKGNKKLFHQLIELAIPFLLLLITLAHVMHYTNNTSYTLLSLDYAQKGTYYNGGWLGAVIGELLLGLFGTYGTYIVLTILVGIWVLITTQFTILAWLGEQILKGIQKIQIAYKSYIEAYRTRKRLKKMQKQLEKEYNETKQLPQTKEDHPPIKVSSMEVDYDLNGDQPLVTPVDQELEVIDTEEELAVSASQAQAQAIVSDIKPQGQTYQPQQYSYPDLELLSAANRTQSHKVTSRESLNNAQKLEETLRSFGVEAKVLQIDRGPTVTRYELQPKQGVKVSKIVNLADDIALNLAASGIRIEAPIPGKSAVGIEVPNEKSEMVYLRDVIASDNFQAFPSKLAFALGKDIAGKVIVSDIAKMPHILIAGATGSGKSVCINTLITGILYKAKPDEVKLIMIDPKVVELNVYNGIPHLLIPVVTDPKKAAGALCWAVNEMTKRYNLFAENNVRDMTGFNRKNTDPDQHMPNIIIIIDELADLMMTAAKEVEDAICRLAQMARAAGIHLVIATQRPSVDVITGVIKANIPSRLAFAVSSGTDSRTILDMNGAEKLLGKGDMLFNPIGASKPIRIQGAFISDKEVESIVESIKEEEGVADYKEEVMEQILKPISIEEDQEEDELLDQAINLAKTKEKVSISMFQRYFKIGFNRASRLMDALEKRGVVGPDEGSKPRKVLIREENQDV